MNSKITTGIIIFIIGVALIIISPNLLFTETVGTYKVGFMQEPITQTTDLRNVTLFFGVALLIVGGIISAVGFGSKKTISPNQQRPGILLYRVVAQSCERR